MEVTHLSASAMATAIADGELSSAEIVDACIGRIETVEPAINAMVARRFEQARAEAAEADQRRAARETLGPLHGVPVTIKDCLDLAGQPTTCGFPRLAGHRPEQDEIHVGRWRSAGAIVLGKTNVAQALAFIETDNPLFGRTANPWNVERSSGGSSGGEGAIIAAGGSPLGMGTDIGGSVRVPAAFCGIASLKPTAGRLPDEGRFSFHPGQRIVRAQVGVLARQVADVALGVAAAAAGSVRPLDDHAAVEIGRLRVAMYETDGTFPVTPAARRAVSDAALALKDAGLTVEPWTPPDPGLGEELAFAMLGADRLAWIRALARGGATDPRVTRLLRFSALPRPLLGALRTLVRLSGDPAAADALRVFDLPRSAGDHLAAVDHVLSYRRRWRDALDEGAFDLVLCPASPVPAVTHGATADLGVLGATTILYNLLGYPAGVVPWTAVRPDEAEPGPAVRGRAARRLREVVAGSAGLPMGVQVVGRPWRDHEVLAAMAAIEAASRHQGEHPGHPAL
jgi:fatty acid amide hydrolase